MMDRSQAQARWQTEGERLLRRFNRAFAAIPKPQHFTDYRHCEECAEHDDTLRRHDRESLPLEAVDNPGWNPLCFITAEGLRYYLPAMVRLGFGPESMGFLSSFIGFHRCSSVFGPMELDREQLEAVVDLARTVSSFVDEFKELEFDRADIARTTEAWEACLAGAAQPKR